MSAETSEEMKTCLDSLGEYERELGGGAREDRFVAALKAYRPVEDEWYDYLPDRAAGVPELAPEDLEVDGKRGALLLKRLPRGLPELASDEL